VARSGFWTRFIVLDAGEMEMISLINDPDLIRNILEHLVRWKPHAASDPRKPKAPALGPVVGEVFEDGWPAYEKPAIMIH
jgi:hypothetical protein